MTTTTQKLSLVHNVTKPLAKRDQIYLLKESLVTTSFYIERIRKNLGWQYLELYQGHNANLYIKARLARTYYDMIHTMTFDDQVCMVLVKHAVEQREGYYLFQFSPAVMDELESIPNKPKLLSPPLVYVNRQLRSLVASPFYGRYRKDAFGHSTLCVRRRGEEFFFAINGKGTHFPTIDCPFMSEFPTAIVDSMFKPFGKTFNDSYLVLKGLFNQWWDYKF